VKDKLLHPDDYDKVETQKVSILLIIDLGS